ncbi:Ras-related RABF1 [Chlorella sorokiniana]|uniref:Ras-related RABF1 n=1 Tax=Chlorella sorokiniana TaxID=3076 RepID=A0A2P6TE73_CHLSO|nr:Ras-related RABF1 [Chlorella sorokiniana]|eukprot:PRW20941.1 Ras-related RABF1 [Chlorella sorokiniana]
MGCATKAEHAASAPLPGVGGATAVAGGPPRCKLVLLGDSGVGKSALVQRQCRGTFNPDMTVTVGAAFLAHTLSLPSGVAVKFEIWDTAGQERYESLAPLYYRGATAAAIVFDVSSEKSFARAQHWVAELQRHASQRPLMVLVGNKTDLPAEERAVTREAAAELADSNDMLYIETSAKTGSNVAALFELIAEHIAAPPPT